MTTSPDETTQALLRHLEGDQRAADVLLPKVYEELHRIAASLLQGEQGCTLNATTLVHEAYLRLVDHERMDWKGRSHFCSMAARTIRRILVDAARRRQADKRGGGERAVTLETGIEGEGRPPMELLDLHQALERLAADHPRAAEVIELRFFGGLSHKEVAYLLGESERNVYYHWELGRSWLYRELQVPP